MSFKNGINQRKYLNWPQIELSVVAMKVFLVCKKRTPSVGSF